MSVSHVFFFCFLLLGCKNNIPNAPIEFKTADIIDAKGIDKLIEVPVPEGYSRIASDQNSFTSWLRQLPIRDDNTVYLFNGQRKKNQSAQFAVIDLPRSKTDLQQCADVVMRLRAEYLFSQKKYESIRFMDYNGKWYQWPGGNNRAKFENYLQQVFGWCGSASLEKQLNPVTDFKDISVGDVLITGGFPGHAVIISDMAINNKGEKIYLLIQGYQPAQDIHILLNPSDPNLSPWYKVTSEEQINTPEWKFNISHLRRW